MPACDPQGLSGVSDRRGGVGRHLAAQLHEPAALGARPRVLQQPFGALQPAVPGRQIAEGREVAHRQPQCGTSSAAGIARLLIAQTGARPPFDARADLFEPEQCVAQTLEGRRGFFTLETGLEVLTRGGPVSARKCRRTLGDSPVNRAHGWIMDGRALVATSRWFHANRLQSGYARTLYSWWQRPRTGGTTSIPGSLSIISFRGVHAALSPATDQSPKRSSFTQSRIS